MTSASDAGPEASASYLLQRLAVVEARVRRAVEHRRADDADPGDRFRGLYISEAEVDRLLTLDRQSPTVPPPTSDSAAHLARLEAEADRAEEGGAGIRLRALARAFSLDDLDVEVLLVALAPDVDPRFERLYAYLHDDVSRRRASIGLALELCGASLVGHERRRFGPAGSLVADGLVLVEESDRPFLTRSLRVPDRVAAHLLGDDTPDPLVQSLATPCAPAEVGDLTLLESALRSGGGTVYIRQPPAGAGLALAVTALSRLGMPTVALDLTRFAADGDVEEVVRRAARDARLQGAHSSPGLSRPSPKGVRPGPGPWPKPAARWWSSVPAAGIPSGRGRRRSR